MHEMCILRTINGNDANETNQHNQPTQHTMKNEKYNGWTNYATWRVNLEIFDGLRSDMDDETVTAEYCEQYAEAVIFDEFDDDQGLAGSYARAFIADVNWNEIAEALNEL